MSQTRLLLVGIVGRTRVPAVEFLGVFLPHSVKPVCNGGILSKQEKPNSDAQGQLTKNTSCFCTHY